MQDDHERLPYYDDEDVYTSSTKYHRSSCHMIGKIRRRNLKRLKSWRSAVELGLEPCGICMPPSGAPTVKLVASVGPVRVVDLGAPFAGAKPLPVINTEAASGPKGAEEIAAIEQRIAELEQEIEAEQIAAWEQWARDRMAEGMEPAEIQRIAHEAVQGLPEAAQWPPGYQASAPREPYREHGIARQEGIAVRRIAAAERQMEEAKKGNASASPRSPAAGPGAASQLDEAIQGAPNGSAQQGSVTGPAAPAQISQLPAAEVTNWRRRIAQAISRLDQTGDRPLNEGLAAHISRLSREGAIPRSIAAMMRAITEMRNAVEYDSKTLSNNENVAAWANWVAIQEWASKEGLQI
jgi:hypothetical protein